MTAAEFLKEADATISIRFAKNQDAAMRDKFIVSLRRGDEDYSFPFYGSTYCWMNGNDATPDIVLACVQKEDPGDMADFIDACGYTIENGESFRKVEKIWKACKNEYDSLLRMFGPELMKKLAEVN